MAEGRLAGKRVLISGVGGGQGEAAFRLFTSEGAAVAGCDIQPGRAEAVAEELRAQGHRAYGDTANLADPADAERWVNGALEQLGGVDVLYNNAAGVRFGMVDEMSVEDWDFTIANELSLVFYTTRTAWPHLLKSRGSIINVGSVAGMMGHEAIPSVAHAATKGACIAMTRQLAAEGGRYGLRANSISPGFVDTPATRATTDPARRAEILAEFVLDTPTETHDVAELALFLASDHSRQITGANITIDAGFTAARAAVVDFRPAEEAA